jgi:PHS family inorganic phosphate transporter-like MFS transporter
MNVLKGEWHPSPLAVGLAAAAASGLGLAVALWMLPETKGRSLEDLSAAPAAARA